MATARKDKIARIMKVQQHLHQLAEMKVAHLDREKAELEEGEKSLIEALNQDEALQGLFVEAMARRLNALARESDRVNRDLDAASRHMNEAALRLKRMERLGDTAEREHLREAWKHGFEDLIDALVGKGRASFP